MKNVIRLVLPLLLAALLLAACPLTAAASATASIAFSSSSLTPGDTLTVTVSFSTTEQSVGAVDATLSYDAAVLQFVSGDGVSGGGGVLKLSAYASSQADSAGARRITLTFKALTAGSGAVQVTGSSVYLWDETLAGNPTAGATVKVTDKTLSQNANLKSLKISAGRLSPAFSADTTAYSVTVDNSVTSLSVSAVAADADASVQVSGSKSLKEGTNKRTVTVTAPGGATKAYTLTITREAAAPTEPTDTPPDESQEPETPPCTLTYDGALYTVATDLADKSLPEGYSVTETAVGEQTVPAALSANGAIHLLWLTAAENPEDPGAFFVYSSEQDLLFPFRPLVTAGGVYALAPADGAQALSGLAAAEWELDGQTVSVWTFSEPEWADFCVLYALDPDGALGFFRYDTVKKTAQRYVPVAPTTAPVAATIATEIAPVPALVGITLPWLIAGGLGLVCIALAILAVIFYRRTLTPPKH